MTKTNYLVRKLKKIWPYIWQPIIAGCYITTVLYLMMHVSTSIVLSIIGVTSLSSTAFIVFTNPDSDAAKLLHLWGGYAIGIISGLFCFYISHTIVRYASLDLDRMYIYTIGGAAAIALAISLMCTLRLRHPPASGMALGLVIEPWDYHSLLVVLTAIVLASLLKTLFKPYLRPL